MKRVFSTTLGTVLLCSFCLIAANGFAKPETSFAQRLTPPNRCLSYQFVAVPNPRLSTAITAIVPTGPRINVSQAKGLAVFAHRMLDKVHKFSKTIIFVFDDEKAAFKFATYQNARKAAPLTVKDFQVLAPILKKAVICYFSDRKRTRFFEPAKAPDTWWKPLFAAQKPAPKTQKPDPK